MMWVRLANLILLLADQVKAFLVLKKKQEIIDAKDKSLESGDQRGLENALSDDTNNDNIDLPVGKYPGMYERAAKKKP